MKKHLFSFLAILSLGLNATTYTVGPGKTYASIGLVPTHNLNSGDSVKVYYQSTPYFEKFVVKGVGTITSPIVIIGIADISGNKPILDGKNAVSSTLYNGYNEDRQIIKVGEGTSSDYIVIEGFEFRNANDLNTYKDDTGNNQSYIANACGVRPEMCDHITIRNCEVYDCGNGFQGGGGNPQVLTLESCYIHDNGLSSNLASTQQHNIYGNGGAGSTLIVQYCYFGNTQNDGQNLKTRSETTIIRYSWIQGGKNGQLDLVDDATNGPSSSYVYGNVIVKPTIANNGRIVLWGQDNGNSQTATLYFFNNTVMNKYSSGRFFDLNDAGRTIVINNNIFYNVTTCYTFGNFINTYSGSDNWLTSNITGAGSLTNSITGTNPMFTSTFTPDFHLMAGSPCIDIVSGYVEPGGHTLNKQYVSDLQYTSRSVVNGKLDLGAFEYGLTGVKENSTVNNFEVFPNPTTNTFNLIYSLQKESTVTIDITDVTGKVVRSNSLGVQQKGEYIQKMEFGNDLRKGIYFVAIKTNENTSVKRLVID